MGLISTLSTQARQNMHGSIDLKRRCYKQICLRVVVFFLNMEAWNTSKLQLQKYKEGQVVPKDTLSVIQQYILCVF